MSVKNSLVPAAWKSGRTARNGKGTYYTDGDKLWSYNLLIGYTNDDGQKVVIDYRSPNFVSQTTSSHVGRAMLHADMDTMPKEGA